MSFERLPKWAFVTLFTHEIGVIAVGYWALVLWKSDFIQ